MNKRKILAGFLAFIMAFALIPTINGINYVYANTFTVEAGEFTVIQVSVPGNIVSVSASNLEAAWMGGNSIGVTTTLAQGGQTFSVTVFYEVPATVDIPARTGVQVISISVRQPDATNADFTLMPHAPIELRAGVTQIITATLRNITTHSATQVSLLPRVNPNPNFTVEAVTTGSFALAGNAQRDVQLSITPNATIIGEPTSIPVELSFRNNINQVQFVTVNLPILITDTRDEPRVVMSGFAVSQQNLQPGQNFSVTATLQNVSNVEARNVGLRAEGFANHLMIIGNATSFVGSIPSGASRDVVFNFTSQSDLESGSRPINLVLTHDDADGTPISATFPQFVTITADGVGADQRAHLDMTISPPTGNFHAGDEGGFVVTITNSGNYDARNIRLTATPQAGIVSRMPTIHTALTLSAGASQTYQFSFSPTMSATTGFHNVEFALQYNNGGETRNFSQFNGMNVVMDDELSDVASLSISNITFPVGQFMPGEQAHFSVTITNHGQRVARNIRLSAAPEAGLVNSLGSIQTLPSLDIGQSRAFEFAFSPTAAATNRFHNIGFTLAYDDGNERQSFEQFTGVTVYNPEEDEENRSRPRIIISDYTVEPLVVMANSEFDLYLTIQNTHPDRSVQNIRVTWQVMGIPVGQGQQATPSAVFTPVGASNTFHIQEILPRATYDHHMRLFAIPDATAMNHIISFRFDYEDDTASPLEATEDIGVNVRQVARLDIGDANIPTDMMLGFPQQISFNVHNISRSNLYNVRVRFEGEGINATNADEIFGNMQPGHFGNFWGSITAEMPGPTTVYMVATFEDAMAEQHEMRIPYIVNVMGGMGGDFGGGDFGLPPIGGPDFGFGPDPWGEEESEGIQTWLIVVISVAVVGIGTLSFFLIRRHLKRRGQFEDDDDDF